MKSIILTFLSIVCIFGQTYIVNIAENPNQASTGIPNAGTGNDWIASANTNTIYTGGSFTFTANSVYIKSDDNWTSPRLTITYNSDQLVTTAAAIEVHVQIGNGDETCDQNGFILRRAAGSSQFIFQAYGASGSMQYKTTTDMSADLTALHSKKLVIDASVSPWDVDLYINDVQLSWTAWDGNPAVAEFNADIYFGTSSIWEPEDRVSAILIWEQPEETTVTENKKSFDDYNKYNNYKD